MFMGRWRPPSPKSSPYITRRGYQSLEKEMTMLWEKRAEVTKALAAAAAEGDRSENAEYIYRKKQLREIDSRVTYLHKRMPTLKIVDQVGDKNKVFFGATVTLEDEQGNVHIHRIVGADEIDPDKSHISLDSPVAKALLGKSVGESISINSDDTIKKFDITAIEYEK
jgi:transcription elongation factor GreB